MMTEPVFTVRMFVSPLRHCTFTVCDPEVVFGITKSPSMTPRTLAEEMNRSVFAWMAPLTKTAQEPVVAVALEASRENRTLMYSTLFGAPKLGAKFGSLCG